MQKVKKTFSTGFLNPFLSACLLSFVLMLLLVSANLALTKGIAYFVA